MKIRIKDDKLNLADNPNVVEHKSYYKHKTMDFEVLLHPNPSCITDIDEYEAQTRAVIKYVDQLTEPYVFEKNKIVPARLSSNGKFTSRSGSQVISTITGNPTIEFCWSHYGVQNQLIGWARQMSSG